MRLNKSGLFVGLLFIAVVIILIIRNQTIKTEVRKQSATKIGESIVEVAPDLHTVIAVLKAEGIRPTDTKIGDLYLVCYAEVDIITGDDLLETIAIPLLWWDSETRRLFMPGLGFLKSGGKTEGVPKPDAGFCINFTKSALLQSASEVKVNLYSGPNDNAKEQAAMLEKAWSSISVPKSFWDTKNVKELPQLFARPFLMVSDIGSAPVKAD